MSHYKYINDCNMSCDYASRKQRMLGQIFAVCMIIHAHSPFFSFFYHNYITLTNNSSCEHNTPIIHRYVIYEEYYMRNAI